MRVIIVCMLVAVASALPVSHVIEVGTNGVIGSSIASPLVSLLINEKGTGNLVSVEGLPVQTPIQPETPAAAPEVLPAPAVPGVVAPAPAPVELPSPAVPEIVVPAPAPVVLPAPAVPGVVAPAPAPAPVVIPAPAVPGVVAPAPAPAPVVLPAPAVPGVVAPAPTPTPVVLPAPAVPDVVAPVPEAINVADEVIQPVIVVDDAIASGPAAENAGVTNNYYINVLLQFFTGQDGSTTVSSSSSFSR